MTAPLARELLGHAQPLRAFVGHVEPTFDWTLSFPPNRQVLTKDLVDAFYTEVCLGKPIGLALGRLYPASASGFSGRYTNACVPSRARFSCNTQGRRSSGPSGSQAFREPDPNDRGRERPECAGRVPERVAAGADQVWLDRDR
jgi:hypothetical protein